VKTAEALRKQQAKDQQHNDADCPFGCRLMHTHGGFG
jgi:hypothetical protein